MRVQFDEMKHTIKKALLQAGLTEDQAEQVATTHTESSLEGVYSHGLNRVPRFIQYVREGLVDIQGTPELLKGKGVMENYDGHLGIGILNAKFSMNRAVELAGTHGIGIVALRNTTHWMRGGTYAWDAVKSGYIGMCWTNTESCMPAWGGINGAVGNNPLCMGIPHGDSPVVLDMAMSQFSYGKLEVTRLKGQNLPIPGGYDSEGHLTADPGAIEASRRLLPTGYWKGSGLSVALDLIAAILSAGNSTSMIDEIGLGSCGRCSQIFIAIDPQVFATPEEVQKIVASTKAQLHGSLPVQEGQTVRYPGEGTMAVRKENLELGIPVDESVWSQVCALAE